MVFLTNAGEDDNRRKAMWLFVVLVLFAAVAVFVFIKKAKKKELPDVRYVCDICGDKDCVCHKENT